MISRPSSNRWTCAYSIPDSDRFERHAYPRASPDVEGQSLPNTQVRKDVRIIQRKEIHPLAGTLSEAVRTTRKPREDPFWQEKSRRRATLEIELQSHPWQVPNGGLDPDDSLEKNALSCHTLHTPAEPCTQGNHVMSTVHSVGPPRNARTLLRKNPKQTHGVSPMRAMRSCTFLWSSRPPYARPLDKNPTIS